MDNKKPLNFVIPKKRRVDTPVLENYNNNEGLSASSSSQIPVGHTITEATNDQKQALLLHLSKKETERLWSEDCWKYVQVKHVQMIQNAKLENDFQSYKKRNNLHQENMGYRMVYEEDEIERIASEGLKVGCDPIVEIGDPQKGVMIYNSPALSYAGRFLYTNVPIQVMVFRVVSGGKRQEIPLSSGSVEPSKKYNCHVLMKTDVNSKKFHRLTLEHLLGGVYHYEYFENMSDFKKYPSMILPHAVVTYELLPTARFNSHKKFTKIDRYYLEFERIEQGDHSITTGKRTFEGKIYKNLAMKETSFVLREQGIVHSVIKNNIDQYQELLVFRSPKYFGSLLTSESVNVRGFGTYSYCLFSLTGDFRELTKILRKSNSVLVWLHKQYSIYYFMSGPLATDFGFPHISNSLHMIVHLKERDCFIPHSISNCNMNVGGELVSNELNSFVMSADKDFKSKLEPDDICDDIFDDVEDTSDYEPLEANISLEVTPARSSALSSEQSSPMVNVESLPNCQTYPKGILRKVGKPKKIPIRWRDYEYTNHKPEELAFVRLIEPIHSVNAKTSFAQKQKKEHELEKIKKTIASGKDSVSSPNDTIRDSESPLPQEQEPSTSSPPHIPSHRRLLSKHPARSRRRFFDDGIGTNYPPIVRPIGFKCQADITREQLEESLRSLPDMTQPPPTTSAPNFNEPPPPIARPTPVQHGFNTSQNAPGASMALAPPGLVKPQLASSSTLNPVTAQPAEDNNSPRPVPPFQSNYKLPATITTMVAVSPMEEKGEESMDLDNDEEDQAGTTSEGNGVERNDEPVFNMNSIDSIDLKKLDKSVTETLNTLRNDAVLEQFRKLREEGIRLRESNELAARNSDLRATTTSTSSSNDSSSHPSKSLASILSSISNYDEDDDDKSKEAGTSKDTDYRSKIPSTSSASINHFPNDRDDRVLKEPPAPDPREPPGLLDQQAGISKSLSNMFPNVAKFAGNGELNSMITTPSSSNTAQKRVHSPCATPPREVVPDFRPNSFLDHVKEHLEQQKMIASSTIEEDQNSTNTQIHVSPKKSPKKPIDHDYVGPSTSDARAQISWNKSVSSETRSSVNAGEKPERVEIECITLSSDEEGEIPNPSKKVVAAGDAPPGITLRRGSSSQSRLQIQDAEPSVNGQNGSNRYSHGHHSNQSYRGGFNSHGNYHNGNGHHSSQTKSKWMVSLRPISDQGAQNYSILMDPLLRESEVRIGDLRDLFGMLHKLKQSIPPVSPRIHSTIFIHQNQYSLMTNKDNQNSFMTKYFPVFNEFMNSHPPLVEILPRHMPCDSLCFQLADFGECFLQIHQYRKSRSAIFLTNRYDEEHKDVKCMVDNGIKVMSIRELHDFIKSKCGDQQYYVS